MPVDQSIWGYFFNAGVVVKLVMLLLLVASLASWTIIFQRGILFSKFLRSISLFEKRFLKCANLKLLYGELVGHTLINQGLARIFRAGFKEYLRLQQFSNSQQPILDLEVIQRTMRIAYSREVERLEMHLPFLASVGSVSPYVGLFGTVWGIMTSFQALGSAQQATIALVAPGIAEALVATAMGLFTAIPAVLAYNRYSNKVNQIMVKLETFQEELSNRLQRQPVKLA